MQGQRERASGHCRLSTFEGVADLAAWADAGAGWLADKADADRTAVVSGEGGEVEESEWGRSDHG